MGNPPSFLFATTPLLKTFILGATAGILGVITTLKFSPPIINIEHKCPPPPSANEALAWLQSLGWQVHLLLLLTFLRAISWLCYSQLNKWAHQVHQTGFKLKWAHFKAPIPIHITLCFISGVIGGLITNWLNPIDPIQWICTCTEGAIPGVVLKGKKKIRVFIYVNSRAYHWAGEHPFLAVWALLVGVNLIILILLTWETIRLAAGYPRQISEEDEKAEEQDEENPFDRLIPTLEWCEDKIKHLWRKRPWRKL